MADRGGRCFVIMPFLPELHYFYLYVKGHIEQRHAIVCDRADAAVLTVPLLEKIRQYIRDADVLIADCTGRNANVFYELGLAHEQAKPVILITQDPIPDAPSDVRHFEFIRYELAKHTEFLRQLDDALDNVLLAKHESLFDVAVGILAQFRQETGLNVRHAARAEFVARVRSREREGNPPPAESDPGVLRFVLPLVIGDVYDFNLIKRITEWVTAKDQQT